jgi:hypothetical protein
MSDSMPNSDAAAPAPLRCPCGYDLSGLPSAYETACPECGRLVIDTRRSRPPFAPVWVLVLIVFMPTAAIGVLVWQLGLWSVMLAVTPLARAGVVLFVPWLLAGSLPALFELIRVTFRPASTVYSVAFVFAALVVLATAYLWVAAAAAWVFG